jgi:hypothetical protein
MKNLIVWGCAITLLTSCASVEKMLEHGDYEGLVAKVTHKLAGNKKKDAYVKALELGYSKMTQEDLAEIETLKSNHQTGDWERIIYLGERMNKIQNMIAPLLPLVSETGHRARFNFFNTNTIVNEAKKNAASLYYTRLGLLKETAYDGNKPAAREAVHVIDRIQALSEDYELSSLRNDMIDKGINKIWVTIEDHSYTRLPFRAEDALYDMPINNTDDYWNRFYTAVSDKTELDYKVVFRINELRATPEEYRTIEENFYREVNDGWEYILDNKGNVAKDTLGNDLKKDRKVKVKGTVVQTTLNKRAYVRGTMEVIQIKTGLVTYSRDIQSEDCFSYTARNYFGDERALDNHQKVRINPVACPSDLEMMLRVADKAKRSFLYEVKHNDYL